MKNKYENQNMKDLIDIDLIENKEIDLDFKIKGFKTNSQDIQKGDVFFCTMGATVDRHEYIDDAIEKGAIAAVISKDLEDKSIPLIKVKDVNKYLIEFAKKYYNHPEKDLKIIGITGTDGKTSTTEIMQTIIGEDICGYIGTNGWTYKGFHHELDNTTPSIELLMKIFAEMRDENIKYIAMEVSSEAVFYGRVKNLYFDIAGYTNVTREHLNTHKTLENYVNCKKQVFRQLKKEGFSVINNDDKYKEEFLDIMPNALTYGKKENSDMLIKKFKFSKDGKETKVKYEYKGEEIDLTIPLIGEFNVYNFALALLISLELKIDLNTIKQNIENINVEGRMDYIEEGQDYLVIVDFAHTPNGIQKVLEYANSIKTEKNKIITIVGQPGGRDKDKRKEVGKIVSDLSDVSIFTLDNPRDENVEDIINMMMENIEDSKKEEIIKKDKRQEAINYALDIAETGDILLLLGKGNETYDIIKGQHIPFNDKEEVTKGIKERFNRR